MAPFDMRRLTLPDVEAMLAHHQRTITAAAEQADRDELMRRHREKLREMGIARG